jgi:hypothetical protein
MLASDLVGGEKSPVAKDIAFVGSIKWRSGTAFDAADLNKLAVDAPSVPGYSAASTRLIGVSRSGFSAHPAVEISPDDLLAAWS